MKKLLLAIAVLMFTNSTCFALDVDLNKEGQYQKKVMDMGFSILNANRIEKRVVFQYKDNRSVNAYANSLDKSVVVLRGIAPYVDDDAELAGILSHEIAHNVDYYGGFFRKLAMNFTPKKYEQKADKIAVDYMVKAGYDPVALITILNKIGGQADYEFLETHPLTSKRLASIYEYIYKKYPAYLVDNEYKENIYYQNFLLTSRDAREKIRKNQDKINKNKEGKI